MDEFKKYNNNPTELISQKEDTVKTRCTHNMTSLTFILSLPRPSSGTVLRKEDKS